MLFGFCKSKIFYFFNLKNQSSFWLLLDEHVRSSKQCIKKMEYNRPNPFLVNENDNLKIIALNKIKSTFSHVHEYQNSET